MESGICFWVWFWSGFRISPMVNCWLTSYESPGSILLQRSWFQVQFFKTKKIDSLSLEPVPKIRPNFHLIFLTWTGTSSSHLPEPGTCPTLFQTFQLIGRKWSIQGIKPFHMIRSKWSSPLVMNVEVETWERNKRGERERERRWGSTCSSSSSSSNLYFPGSSNNCLQFGTFALLHSSPCQILFLLLAFWWDLGGPEGKERWEAGLR